MNRTGKVLTYVFVLFAGISIGGTALSPVSADNATTTPNPTLASTSPTPTGELLKVCIDLKSGAIRAASKCLKAERATTLGGIGPQGPIGTQGPVGPVGPIGATGAQGPQGVAGPVGLTGPQGVAGPVGLTGPAGSVLGLRQTTLTTYTPSNIFGSCSSFGISALTPSTRISISSYGTSLSSISASLVANCINFSPTSITVYTP